MRAYEKRKLVCCREGYGYVAEIHVGRSGDPEPSVEVVLYLPVNSLGGNVIPFLTP